MELRPKSQILNRKISVSNPPLSQNPDLFHQHHTSYLQTAYSPSACPWIIVDASPLTPFPVRMGLESSTLLVMLPRDDATE
jgi:hypothetical protein